MARELPAFDSVWIDALLQARKLTPFQAQLLEAGQADRLTVGPCLLVDRLGYGYSAQSYLARRRDGNERCILKLIDSSPETVPHGLQALEDLVTRLNGWTHASLVAPHTALRWSDQLVTVSRYVPGPHLGELLIRRGRVPPSVVMEIARQLVDGLAALEDRDCVHGDIRLSNVRLTSGGVAVLVDAAIDPAVAPELTVHARLPPDRFDGTAPERIGTGRPPTAVSDIYALGCLLWHLLAARPPFPTGDPLAKLASHQTEEVADVREWVPDTPSALAEAIGWFTARDPQSRPQSFREIRRKWRPPRRAGRKRLARFRARFHTEAPRIPAAAGSHSSSRWPWAVALLLVLTGATLSMLDHGARTLALRVPRFLQETPVETATDPVPADPAPQLSHTSRRMVDSPPPVPAPRSDGTRGVIDLTAERPYRATDLSHVGSLVIRGIGNKPAEILVTDQPLRVSAQTLILENVTFRHSPSPPERKGPGRTGRPEDGRPSPTSPALLTVQAQDLTVRNCLFRAAPFAPQARSSEEPDRPPAPPGPSGLVWTPLDPRDRTGRTISLHNTVFLGTPSAVVCTEAPLQVHGSNCLLLGGGALLDLARPPRPGHELAVAVDKLSLRRAESLLRIRLPQSDTEAGTIHVEADAAVLGLSGPRAALLQFLGNARPPNHWPSVEVTGMGTLMTSQAAVAARLETEPENQRFVPLQDPPAVTVEGLSAVEFDFTGPFTADPRDSLIQADSLQIPLFSSQPPGIVPENLPSPPSGD